MFHHPVMFNSVTPWTAAQQASLSLTISWGLPTFVSITSVMHPAISSSDTLFSICPQSFPASETSPMSWLFASGDQYTEASASASVPPMSIQGWFPLRLTGLISLLSEGLSGVFSNTTIWRHQFCGALPSLRFSSHNHVWPLGRPQPWLYRLLLAEWCLCFSFFLFFMSLLFSIHLCLSWLSCQEAIVLWFHGCGHHPQWFYNPRRRNLSLLPPFPLLFAVKWWNLLLMNWNAFFW